MICNDTVCFWPITSSNIFIFDHNYSVKGGFERILLHCSISGILAPLRYMSFEVQLHVGALAQLDLYNFLLEGEGLG